MGDIPELLEPADALARILAHATPLPLEDAAIDAAVGRALGAEVRALRTLPPWDNSAMDGYAVRAEDAARAPVTLRLTQTVLAGQVPIRALGPGEACRVTTGAPVPPDTDLVVMQEKTRRPSEGEVELLEGGPPGQHLRPRGLDAREGEVLLPSGTPVGLGEAALLYAQGMGTVRVPRRPGVSLVATGDELCPWDQVTPDRIVDTNTPSLALAVGRAGGVPRALGIAPDDREAVFRLFDRAKDADVVLSSAGVSVGERDYVRETLERLGVTLHFWKVAIKPGKPLLFGTRGRTLFFGLPGNPASSLVTFELFVRPALLALQGHPDPAPPTVPGVSQVDLKKGPGLTHYLRVTATVRDGALWASPLSTQLSGALRSTQATHLLVFPKDATRLEAGQPVDLIPVRWGAL